MATSVNTERTDISLPRFDCSENFRREARGLDRSRVTDRVFKGPDLNTKCLTHRF